MSCGDEGPAYCSALHHVGAVQQLTCRHKHDIKQSPLEVYVAVDLLPNCRGMHSVQSANFSLESVGVPCRQKLSVQRCLTATAATVHDGTDVDGNSKRHGKQGIHQSKPGSCGQDRLQLNLALQ